MLPFQFALIQQRFLLHKLRVYNALCVSIGTEGLLFKPASQTCRSLTVIGQNDCRYKFIKIISKKPEYFG